MKDDVRRDNEYVASMIRLVEPPDGATEARKHNMEIERRTKMQGASIKLRRTLGEIYDLLWEPCPK